MIMSNETERTLHELKLPGMASCWSSLEETHQLDKLTLREGMQIMLQYERDTRGNNRIQRLIKNAGFRLRASMEELETDTARGIQACSAADLATGNYITGGMTVIITGPAGTGKSYFACALGDRVKSFFDFFKSLFSLVCCICRISDSSVIIPRHSTDVNTFFTIVFHFLY